MKNKPGSKRAAPEFFLPQFYYPASEATVGAVEALRIELGLQDRDTSREAVSGFLVACRGLRWQGSDMLGFAHDPKSYDRGHATYTKMREALRALEYLTLVRKGYKDVETGENSISTYKVLRFPEACSEELQFEHRPPDRPVTVRLHKAKWGEASDENSGKVLTRSQSIKALGDAFHIEELRLSGLNRFLGEHPLVMDGVTFRSVSRKFNEGRLDRGGRFYTGYTSKKKELVDPETGEVTYPRKTATIDGEKVNLIDISACFVCVAASMAGLRLATDQDLYSLLPFVSDEESRKWAKALVSTMIAGNGKRSNYSPEMKEKHGRVIGDHKMSYFTTQVHQTFPFLKEVDGLEVMFRESDIMALTLGRCMVAKVPAWPLHDAIFVKASQVEDAKAVLSKAFEDKLGFPPRLSIDRLE